MGWGWNPGPQSGEDVNRPFASEAIGSTGPSASIAVAVTIAFRPSIHPRATRGSSIGVTFLYSTRRKAVRSFGHFHAASRSAVVVTVASSEMVLSTIASA